MLASIEKPATLNMYKLNGNENAVYRRDKLSMGSLAYSYQLICGKSRDTNELRLNFTARGDATCSRYNICVAFKGPENGKPITTMHFKRFDWKGKLILEFRFRVDGKDEETLLEISKSSEMKTIFNIVAGILADIVERKHRIILFDLLGLKNGIADAHTYLVDNAKLKR